MAAAKWRLVGGSPDGAPVLELRHTLELFQPPLHVEWLESCVQLKRDEPRLSLKQMAGRFGIGHMTVKRALSYHRRMQAAGLAVPYLELCEAPPKASRWRGIDH